MTDPQLSAEPSPTTEPTRERPAPASRGGLAGYAGVGVVAILLGAGATFLLMREPVPPDPVATAAGPSHEGHNMAAMTSMPGMDPMADMNAPSDPEAGVYVSPARQQLIGVRTSAVGRREMADAIRTVGVLAYDETRVTHVHTKIAGWIDELFVDFAGKPVQKGQPLFTIYSPDLVASQNEYLLARRAQARLETSRFEETRQGAASLLSTARARLALWDMSDTQIAELDRTGESQRNVTLYASSAGVVLERNVFGGQYVTPDMTLFKIADLSTIWAIGQVAEGDAVRVRLGQSVTIERSNAPGARPIAGRVTFIYPDVDPATRRVRIRMELANPGLTLKPDTFVTVTIEGPAASSLAVPAEAVIDTGLKQYVILARDGGYFEPRVIEAGAPVAGYYPIVRGLAAGDRVVTSAQFLIDSETNLQAAMQAMAGMPGMGSDHLGSDPRRSDPKWSDPARNDR